MIKFQISSIYFKTIGSQRFKFNNIIRIGGEYLYKNEKQSSEYDAMCNKMVKDLVRKVSLVVFVSIFSHLLLAVVPLYLIVFKHIHVTIMGLELPFFEHDSDIGFIVNLVVQAIYGTISMIAVIFSGISIVLTYNTATMIPHILHLDLKDIGHELHSNGMSSNVTLQLRNSFMKCEDYNR